MLRLLTLIAELLSRLFRSIQEEQLRDEGRKQVEDEAREEDTRLSELARRIEADVARTPSDELRERMRRYRRETGR